MISFRKPRTTDGVPQPPEYREPAGTTGAAHRAGRWWMRGRALNQAGLQSPGSARSRGGPTSAAGSGSALGVGAFCILTNQNVTNPYGVRTTSLQRAPGHAGLAVGYGVVHEQAGLNVLDLRLRRVQAVHFSLSAGAVNLVGGVTRTRSPPRDTTTCLKRALRPSLA